MAFFAAKDQFDIGNVNLNFYIKNYYDDVVFDNENFILGGKAYEDFFVINGYSYPNDLVLALGGRDFTFNSIGQLSGGTVTVLTVQTIAGTELWYADGISVPGGAISLAAHTSTNSDDLAVFGTALAGHDTIKLSALADRFDGFSGNDSIFGYDGSDVLKGSGGNDTINGGAGNDILDGGSGADRLIGGTGNDTYVVNKIGDKVVEIAKQGLDMVRASVSYELSASVEKLILTTSKAINGTGNGLANTLIGNAAGNTLKGGTGQDTLLGKNGGDKLWGGNGNDKLSGGTGVDILSGQKGSDILSGGTGADHFVFNRGDGHDRIRDFRAGLDVIEIDSGATRFAQLEIHSTGKLTVIEFADVEITFAGIRPAQLDADDFLFV